ncbi:TonB-dependent receptor plug domain-containing protein, partial [Pseudomonas plecoglossicida]|uniref:TonB-dependent receptor plug domain-containing protein n=1 Tax=Pseudomonas plecoglossicida TaxID=70775 RepID=UPI0011AF0F76
AVSVIDREDIERSQARSVPELLRQVPGVSLANNGGFGKNTTLFLRGTESDHVLVLIDGAVSVIDREDIERSQARSV